MQCDFWNIRWIGFERNEILDEVREMSIQFTYLHNNVGSIKQDPRNIRIYSSRIEC